VSDGKLPSGWSRVKFGDVVRKVSDRVDPATAGIERYVAGEHMDTDDLRIRRWGYVGDGYLGPAFHIRFTPGQVLYGSRRTYLRKVAVADFEGICANTTFVLEPSSSRLLPEFLPLVMTTEAFHDHSKEQSKGSVNPYINFSDLTWFEFALPPVDEQRRITELLCAADRLSETLSSVDLAVLRKSLLVQALETSKEDRPLGEVISLEYGKSLSETRRDGGSYPVIGSAGVVGFHSIPLTTEERTIVVGRKGTAGYVQLIDRPCWPIDTTYYVRLKVDLPLDFVFAQIQEIGLGSVVTATAVPGLNREDAYKLRFRIPDSKTISSLIATLVQTESLGEEISQRRETVRMIRRALLDSMMVGDHV
jgi:hypothetical protein